MNVLKSLRAVVSSAYTRQTDRQFSDKFWSRHHIASNGYYSIRHYRAATCSELGKPLQITEEKSKELKPDQIRVKIHAAGVNFADVLINNGLYQVKHEPPFTSGLEFAGVVIEAGKDTKTKVGTRVVGMEFMTGHAEETCVQENVVHRIPDNMNFATAASGITSSYATAVGALESKARIRPGEKLLVTAAGGALGLAAIDLAKNVYGAEVIAAAGGTDKCNFLEQKGFKTIDYSKESIKEAVKKAHPKGVDVALDSNGGDHFMECFKSMAVDGRLLSLGFSTGKFPSVPVNHMLVKNITVTGFYWGIYHKYDVSYERWTINEAFRYFTEGKINPYIGATFSLDNINDAFAYIMKRKSIGKVVIEIQ
ncbi:quinone oxidoreductase-like protein 2 [Styela clava]